MGNHNHIIMSVRLLFLAVIFAAVFFSFSKTSEAEAWGFYGHRLINRQAVFTLPPEMMPFFKTNIDYLTEHAIDPDKRRYASRFEAVRHYIDLDVYGEAPFDHVPRNWTDALMRFSDLKFVNAKNDTLDLLLREADGSFWETEGLWSFHADLGNGTPILMSKYQIRGFFIENFLPKYYEDNWLVACDSLARFLDTPSDEMNCRMLFAEDHLSEHGIVPWHLQHMLRRLSEAFAEKDSEKIRRHAADIGHYIADAHVPLHTTENYNGQLTGQNGIHAFWESRLPELFAEGEYDFWVGKAEFIDDPETYFWDIVLTSHSLVDSVLLIEKDLRKNFPADRQLCNEMRGENLVMTQCEEFARAYSERLSGMVEKRMSEAIHAVGSAWYTAWVLAGQPDLRTLDRVVSVDSLDLKLEEAVRKGKQKGRVHE